MDYFTSDEHFGHRNILTYCNRPFHDIDKMNGALVWQWNQTVTNKDTVYILGDWCMYGTTNIQKVVDLMNSLNGKKKFIFGNHDNRNMLNKLVADGLVPSLEILGDRAEIKSFDANGVKYDITLCHYAHRTWNKSHYGSLHCFGHSHNTLPGLGRSMDVGVDAKFALYGDWAPFSITQIIEQIGSIPPHNAG